MTRPFLCLEKGVSEESLMWVSAGGIKGADPSPRTPSGSQVVLCAVSACSQIRAFRLVCSRLPFPETLLSTFYKLGAMLGAGETEMCP